MLLVTPTALVMRLLPWARAVEPSAAPPGASPVLAATSPLIGAPPFLKLHVYAAPTSLASVHRG